MRVRKLLPLVLLWLLWPQEGNAWTLLANNTAAENGTTSATTTPALNCTGATLLIVGVSAYNQFPTVSDSKGNTWTSAVSNSANSPNLAAIYYVYVNASQVSASQTFTITDGSNNYSNEFAACFSGAKSSPLDQTNNAFVGAGNFSVQPGSITPTVNGELLLTALDNATGPAATINSGFTVTNAVAYGGGGTSNAGGMAYLVQGTAASINPTWSWGGVGDAGTTVIASFLPNSCPSRPLRGVGC